MELMGGFLIFCICLILFFNPRIESALIDYFHYIQYGEATYYGNYHSGGACGIDPTPVAGISTDWTIAMNSNQYSDSETCGMCIQVIGNGTGLGSDPVIGTFSAFVNDKCPECPRPNIDIALPKDGRWDVEWIAIPCPVGSSLMRYSIQGGYNEWYIKIQVRNHRYPVTSLEIQQQDSWISMERTADNHWESNLYNYPLVFPVSLKVTAVTGEEIVEDVPQETWATLNWDSSFQFSDSNLPDPESNPTNAGSLPFPLIFLPVLELV